MIYVSVTITTKQNLIVNTHKKWERYLNTLKKVIAPYGKRERKEEMNKEELQKQPKNNWQNGNEYVPINNYF